MIGNGTIPPVVDSEDEKKIKRFADMVEASGGCAGCVSGLILLTGLANVWCAWIVTILWRWSLVPLGLPQIGLGPALALDAIVSIWTLRGIRKGEERKGEEIDLFKTFFALTAAPALVLAQVWFWLTVISWL